MNGSLGKTNEELYTIYKELNKVKQDWERALLQFEYAVEEKAIDATIYKIKETETRYMYLLKMVRKIESEQRRKCKSE